MTPEQKEAARKRMAHARAARKIHLDVAVGDVGVAVADPVVVVDAQPDLVLTIRRLRIGSFTGLWELCRINPDGSKMVVSDANTKSLIVSLARNEILKCGQ